MKRVFLAFLLAASFLTACQPEAPATLTVMTHDSFSVSAAVVQVFEQANEIKVIFLKSGDAGEALNKAILARDAPLADVFFGVDNTFLSRALDAQIFDPYPSPQRSSIPEEFLLDPSFSLLPVDYGDVCLNYDVSWFAGNNLPVPASLAELAKPEYRGLLVVENPATSSPGLAFLLATIAQYGEDGYLAYWQSLLDNGLVVVDDWNTAYYTNFSASSGRGAQPLVVSYATSPAAEVFFADPPVTASPTSSVLTPGTCFRQVEFAGILQGTRNRALAEKFMDFMLGIQFQQDIPLQMFMFPVRTGVDLPAVFAAWAQTASQPASLTPQTISANRDRWISEWTQTVVR